MVNRIPSFEILLLISLISFELCFGHSSLQESSSHQHHHHGVGGEHHCSHGHGHHTSHRHSHAKFQLPEELAEEEDLQLYGFDDIFDHDHHHHHDHDHDGISELSNLSLWIYAMGCSLLVSMASLICLIILPVLLFKGKLSKTFVDSLAAFGAGAMLGDAFLHQLPHAFGGGHSHSHDHHVDHNHDDVHHAQSHSHSLKDLSVGLSTLSGIVLFLLVEKIVRYVEDHSGNVANGWGHSHHHHSHKKNDDLKDDCDILNSESVDSKNENKSDISPTKKALDGPSEGSLTNQNNTQKESLRQRITTNGASDEDGLNTVSASESSRQNTLNEKRPDPSPSNLVFGYLNLFSDGVHNFTDGMALGSAFLLHGFVGGWSRTLFLLAHEIPQEVGDFGILVRSGFSVSKALFFNFLSALVALAGTALALLMGQDPGQSSLIEGFTAGGFIYIAVAGVLPEMNSGKMTLKSSAVQLTSLILGMVVALCISLVE
ncbi:Iaa-alanine resistance protein [Thalictrum thalictroides]|uniref:Iaa-alanine resistance protein n=1 Tax=Thalictrum thalictroides TaxID=46969 RepID=A0A7J6XCN6_THATH|nr:Iaa-alanine resistance protein [Thalictrum thalictroides]